jgi:hypothetical protein
MEQRRRGQAGLDDDADFEAAVQRGVQESIANIYAAKVWHMASTSSNR